MTYAVEHTWLLHITGINGQYTDPSSNVGVTRSHHGVEEQNSVAQISYGKSRGT